MATANDPKTYFVNWDQARAFCNFRPYYGDDLYQEILKYHVPKADHSNMELAVDLGCGPGQSTAPLARCFNTVLGIDISPAQILAARMCGQNVSFKVGDAENLKNLVEDHSVDLVTVGQAFHWLNKEKFFSEAKRILKSKGTLAVFNYTSREMLDPTVEAIVKGFDKEMQEYVKVSQENVDTSYIPDVFPFDNIHKVHLPMERQYTRDAMHGYLRSLSYYHLYLRKHHKSQILDQTMEKLEPFFATQGGARCLKMKWKFTLIICQAPNLFSTDD